jgi:hypothetical protein
MHERKGEMYFFQFHYEIMEDWFRQLKYRIYIFLKISMYTILNSMSLTTLKLLINRRLGIKAEWLSCESSARGNGNGSAVLWKKGRNRFYIDCFTLIMITLIVILIIYCLFCFDLIVVVDWLLYVLIVFGRLLIQNIKTSFQHKLS